MSIHQPAGDYDILAAHYDAVYNGSLVTRDEEISIIHDLKDRFHPEARSVLDLGVGTGTILASFQGEAERLIGVDMSPGMLIQAKRKIPEADIRYGDIAEFELGEGVDLAICLFNTLNHLRGIKKWEKFFELTERNLNPGGILVFDTVSLGFMEHLAEPGYGNVWPFKSGDYRLSTTQTGPNEFNSKFVISMNKLGPGPEVVSGDLYHHVYPVVEVKEAASKHLEPVLDFDAKPGVLDDGELEAASDESYRPMFVYRKPEEAIAA